MKDSHTQSDVLGNSEQDAPPIVPLALARLWSRTRMLKEVWVVVQAVGAWPNVAIAPDCNGLVLTLRDLELGHLGWDGRIELPFATAVADRLVAEGMAIHAPGPLGAGRVSFDIQTLVDANRAVWLLRLAYQSVDSNPADSSPDAFHCRRNSATFS